MSSKSDNSRRQSLDVATMTSANYPSQSHSSDYKRDEQQEMLIAPPLDLSFRNAATMNDLMEKCYARTTRTGKAPTRTMKDRYVTGTLWLSNNVLNSMEGLQRLANRVLHDPVHLSWLDLSFNEIDKIGGEIVLFPYLQILYLHGNKISNIADVQKLTNLPKLKSLALHGNPVEDIPCYRRYVVHLLPKLSIFDFSLVTDAEKKTARPIGFAKVIQFNV